MIEIHSWCPSQDEIEMIEDDGTDVKEDIKSITSYRLRSSDNMRELKKQQVEKDVINTRNGANQLPTSNTHHTLRAIA